MIARTPHSVPASSPETTDHEARAVLGTMAHRRFGSLPGTLVAEHVISVTLAREGADWPVCEEAMRALLRRMEFARRDGLRVATRPAGGRPLGEYALRGPRGGKRPYRAVLECVDPLRGSCDCPDYLRNSLGLCKHLLTVLGDLAGKGRRWKRAQAQHASDPVQYRTALRWDPVRALHGRGDWLDQMSLDLAARPPGRVSTAEQQARRWFRIRETGSASLRNTFADDSQRRLELVEDLHTYVSRAGRGSTRIADPAIAALLAHEREHLLRVESLRKKRRALLRTLDSLAHPLYPYQNEGVERMLAEGRLLLADDMGLGKTAQAVACCHALYHRQQVRRGLVIVPASLKAQWLREWQTFSEVPVQVVDGSPEERAEYYRRTQRGYLVINYEQLLRDLDLVRHWNPEVVVLDEAQRIKNWATKTAACVKQLTPPYRFVLTGTPMENRLEEVASIVEWVDDRALEPKWRLAPWHTIVADGDRGTVGARNLATLRERLSPCVVRRVREEVLEQLPPRTDTAVTVAMTGAQELAHTELDMPIAALAARSRQRPLTQPEFMWLMQLLAKQRIISNGLAQLEFEDTWPDLENRRPTERRLRSLDSPKLVEFRELMTQLLGQDRKIVVFSQWRRALQLAHWAVGDLLADRGQRAAFFTGRERQARRRQNLVEFHDDCDVRVLFASDAGGTGLNLQRAANCCINLELPWNPAVLDQRIGRIYRLGQTSPIDVYNLVSESGIEARILGLVGDKRALFRGLFDGATDEILYQGTGAFMKRLERALEADGVSVGRDDADGNGADGIDDIADDEMDDLDDLGDIASAGASDGARASARASDHRSRPAPARASAARELFDGVTIENLGDGRVRIEATPDAATTLAEMFEGMAKLMDAAARTPEQRARRV